MPDDLKGAEALTEEWLADVAGFKWSQQDRQTHKHWTLWLGWAANPQHAIIEDLGVEVTQAWWPGRNGDPVGDVTAWNCWLKGMNSSFLHIRYIRTQGELIELLEALTGQPWDPELSRYGNLYRAEQLAAFDAMTAGGPGHG